MNLMNLMRKVFFIILVICLISIYFTGVAGAAESPGAGAELRFIIGQTTYQINGEIRNMDAAPVIREGRTLLPIRFVAEPLGAAVAWDNMEQKVTITLGDKVIQLWIGKAEALVNGSSVPIDPGNLEVRPLILQNRTMLPLRFVSENMGAKVEWREPDRSISVVRSSGGEEEEDEEKPELAEPQRPVIALFDAEPGSIFAGASTTLSWRILNATAVTLEGESVSATGSKNVSPAVTTTYILRATGETGESAISRETVIVSPSSLPEKPGRVLLPPGGLPGGIRIPGSAEEETEPTPLPGEIITGLRNVLGRPITLMPSREPIYTKIMLDSLYCMKESEWDHGTNSDEPYLVVTGFAGNPEPRSWSVGVIGPFDNVDSEENLRIDGGAGRVVFEGEVTPGSSIGFNVLAWEADECPGDTRSQIADRMASGIRSAFNSATEIFDFGLPDILQGFICRAIGEVISELSSHIYCLLGGGADDLVANETVTLSYEDLRAWAGDDQNMAMALDLDGGEAGHYLLRLHFEFERQASQSFRAKFTNWDDFAVGNLTGDGKDEILIAIDEDASGNDGRFYKYDSAGNLLGTFVAFYTHYDHVAIGDVVGDEYEEVIHACDDDGAWIRVYNTSGERLEESPRFRPEKFTHYDGLAVGNVLGDEKAEILVACDDDKKVYIYSGNGARLGEFGLSWNFDGCRYLADETRHDAFLVGDVLGDGYAEIVMIDQRGEHSKVYVYDAYGRELRAPFDVFFTPNDGAALGNLKGDAKKELLVAADGGDAENGYVIRLYDLLSGSQVGTRFWPCFTNYDGFTAGDVLGTGKDQLLLATDEDDRVYLYK